MNLPPILDLYAGVSRQPPDRRSPGQLEESDNTLHTVARGMEKRPGSNFIAKFSLAGLPIGQSFFVHKIRKSETERYWILQSNYAAAPIIVINMTTGERIPVIYKDAASKTYVNVAPASVRMVTVADTTLILNQTVKAATIADGSAANFGLAMFTTDLVDNYDSPKAFPTSPNAAKFYRADNDWPYDSGVSNPNIYLDARRGYYHGLAANSTIPGLGKFDPRWVDTADLLPDEFRASAVAIESPGYMEVKKTSLAGPLGWRKGVSTGGKMTWTVFPEPQVSNCYLDPATMPQKMVLRAATAGDVTAYGTAGDNQVPGLALNDMICVVSYVDWTPRYNGNDSTNELPSFVGNEIKDMVYFKDRLVLASGESVSMSQTGQAFNFFKKDFTNLSDDDRIDITTNESGVHLVEHLIPFGGQLIAFCSNNRQFQCGAAQTTLSPKTAAFARLTAYNGSKTVRPASGGRQLYFVAESNSIPSIHEFYSTIQDGSAFPSAYNLTEHVQGYVKAGITNLEVSEKNGAVAVLNSLFPSTIWMYRYLRLDEEKVQSAWGQWKVSSRDEILGAFMDGDIMHLLVRQKYEAGVFTSTDTLPEIENDTAQYVLLQVGLNREAPQDDMVFAPHLDWKSRIDPDDLDPGVTFSYDNFFDITTLTVPYADVGLAYRDEDWELILASGPKAGHSVRPYKTSVNLTTRAMTFYFRGRWNEEVAWIGREYLWRARLSRLFFPNPRSNSGAVFTHGTVTIGYMAVGYTDSGYLSVDVVGPLGSRRVSKITPYRVGGPYLSSQVASGSYEAPIMIEAGTSFIELTNPTSVPSNVTSLSYDADFNGR